MPAFCNGGDLSEIAADALYRDPLWEGLLTSGLRFLASSLLIGFEFPFPKRELIVYEIAFDIACCWNCCCSSRLNESSCSADDGVEAKLLLVLEVIALVEL
jgi:hypothetical protein